MGQGSRGSWVSSLMGHFQNVSDTLSALIYAIMLALLIAYCWPFIRPFVSYGLELKSDGQKVRIWCGGKSSLS